MCLKYFEAWALLWTSRTLVSRVYQIRLCHRGTPALYKVKQTECKKDPLTEIRAFSPAPRPAYFTKQNVRAYSQTNWHPIKFLQGKYVSGVMLIKYKCGECQESRWHSSECCLLPSRSTSHISAFISASTFREYLWFLCAILLSGNRTLLEENKIYPLRLVP